MLTFFHGWRRKTGTLTLLMACVFVALWVRSNEWLSLVCYSFDNQHAHQFIVRPDGIEWTKENRSGSWKNHETWLVAYEVFVYPLTMLSAYLLLSKPRAAKPAAVTEN